MPNKLCSSHREVNADADTFEIRRTTQESRIVEDKVEVNLCTFRVQTTIWRVRTQTTEDRTCKGKTFGKVAPFHIEVVLKLTVDQFHMDVDRLVANVNWSFDGCAIDHYSHFR